jgi:hypothetical protein
LFCLAGHHSSQQHQATVGSLTHSDQYNSGGATARNA